jgi:bifunctional non-homologous end joining protein LigD
MSLDEYNKKRNFEKTSEPRGYKEIGSGFPLEAIGIKAREREVIKIEDSMSHTSETDSAEPNSAELDIAGPDSAEPLRYVIQHHLARNDHYDFRLEWKEALLSWAVPKGPSYNPKEKRLAVKVEDHPIDYRNFEGTIPKGEYGGGVVMLWDEGFWEPYGNVDEALEKGLLKFKINGARLKGNWALVRLKSKKSNSDNNWLLLKEKDEYAKVESGILGYDTSIRTGRTMTEIEKGRSKSFIKNPFNSVNVQLAKMVREIPDGDNWFYEMKYDGYRILAFVEGNSARLITRNGRDYTNRFHSIVPSLIELSAGRPMVLDGEMTIINESGKSDFQALQSYVKKPKGQKLTYIVFDLLSIDGEDIRNTPLYERKEILEALMKDCPDNLFYSRHVKGNGEQCFKAACEAGMEGIVGRKYDSVYSGNRNGDWIKLKCSKTQEFVIGGYSQSDKRVSGISSLLLGIYEKGELIYAGRAGTGFNKNNTKKLLDIFSRYARQTSPFKNPPERRSDEEIFWLAPELVAEIQFTEWTEDNKLRHASFKGLREDKNIIISGVKVTSPDKVIYKDPEITKLDIIKYYEKVSNWMLPFVRGRILSIVRCPKGVSEQCFYKKHPGNKLTGVATIPLLSDNGEYEKYFYIEDVTGIISEAQMGTLEFHTWGSRVDELEKPDMMVFDLDPDEQMGIDKVRQGVKDIKSILSELSLKSYLKTSGGKGYHVVVPLKPGVSWEVFHDFARSVAHVMENKWPNQYTSNIRKNKRKNKIFIDWIRNARGATSIAPYSLRARKGGKVSMPIFWDELDTVAPDGIDIFDALSRIEGADPWEDFFNNSQTLKAFT